MKMYIYIFGFLASFSAFAQSNSVNINMTDSAGKKQGKWIRTGKDKPGTCYTNYQVAEEGEYIDNKKTGLWTEYYCNGKMKNILTYKEGRPGGYATLFYENGKRSEEGYWKKNRYVGRYKKYDTLGIVIQDVILDSLGKQ